MAVLLLISLVVAVFCALVTSGARQSRLVVATELEDELSRYCTEVANALNRKIDWHVVVDITGSYNPKSVLVAGALENLLRSLPLRQGDGFHLRLFDQTALSPLAAETFEGEEIGLLLNEPGYAKEALQEWLHSAEEQTRGPGTNLPALLDQLAAETPLREPPDPYPYFIVVTDGFNEPTGGSRHGPLFTEAQAQPSAPGPAGLSPFAEKLLAFVGQGLRQQVEAENILRGRGLLFLIDYHRLRSDRKAKSKKDWESAVLAIDELRKKLPEDWPLEVLPPRFQLLRTANSPLTFPEALRREIGREPGTYACHLGPLAPGGQLEPAARQASATGRQYPVPIKRFPLAFPDAGQIEVVLELDSLRASSEEDQSELSIPFLSYQGYRRPAVFAATAPVPTLRDQGGRHEVPHRFQQWSSPESRPGRWCSQPVAVGIPVSEGLTRRQPLPWSLEMHPPNEPEVVVSRLGLDSRPAFVLAPLVTSTTISAGAGSTLPPTSQDDLWRMLETRGRLGALLASLTLALAHLLDKSIRKRQTVQVEGTITNQGEEGRPYILARLRSEAQPAKDFYHRQHLRYKLANKPESVGDPSKLKFRAARREDGPSVNDDSQVELDVMPMFTSVYFNVNVLDQDEQLDSPEEGESSGKVQEAQAFTYSPEKDSSDKTRTRGYFVKPDSCWNPQGGFLDLLRPGKEVWRQSFRGPRLPSHETLETVKVNGASDERMPFPSRARFDIEVTLRSEFPWVSWVRLGLMLLLAGASALSIVALLLARSPKVFSLATFCAEGGWWELGFWFFVFVLLRVGCNWLARLPKKTWPVIANWAGFVAFNTLYCAALFWSFLVFNPSAQLVLLFIFALIFLLIPFYLHDWIRSRIAHKKSVDGKEIFFEKLFVVAPNALG